MSLSIAQATIIAFTRNWSNMPWSQAHLLMPKERCTRMPLHLTLAPEDQHSPLAIFLLTLPLFTILCLWYSITIFSFLQPEMVHISHKYCSPDSIYLWVYYLHAFNSSWMFTFLWLHNHPPSLPWSLTMDSNIGSMFLNFLRRLDWGCNSAIECLSIIHRALILIHNTTQMKNLLQTTPVVLNFS